MRSRLMMTRKKSKFVASLKHNIIILIVYAQEMRQLPSAISSTVCNYF